MDERENIVVFEDDEGNSFELEIIDYFPYGGQEYVVLAEPGAAGCDCGCEDHEHDPEEVNVYVMQVKPLDDETEEYVPIDEDMEEEVMAYADRYLSGEFDEEEVEDEDEE